MTKKLKLAILCGGRSAEHDISIISAKNIIAALDRKKYKILVIVITKSGEWSLFSSVQQFLQTEDLHHHLKELTSPVTICFGEKTQPFMSINPTPQKFSVDVVFPVLHGPNGEDGTVQGMFDLINVPYVGAGNLSSALCMDKEITKRLLHAAGLPTPEWLVFHKHEKDALSFQSIKKILGLPFFVKPVNMGSSIGIAKIKAPEDFTNAVNEAFRYDRKIIFEETIKGRELECAVLGNNNARASKIAEIIPQHEFYTYEAKYCDPKGAILKVPVKLERGLEKKIQYYAIQTFRLLQCEDMARVDFFLDQNNQVFINELNTIPGFTQISMYPRLWMDQGLSYSELLDELIGYAKEKNIGKS